MESNTGDCMETGPLAVVRMYVRAYMRVERVVPNNQTNRHDWIIRAGFLACSRGGILNVRL